MNQNTAKLLIIIGYVLVVVGILMYFFHDKLQFLGNLPGDFHYKKDNFSFYAPITTMIVLSILLSLLLKLIQKLF